MFPQNIPHDTSTAHNITPPAGGSPGPRCRYILTLFVETFSLSPSSYRITIGQDLSEERRGGVFLSLVKTSKRQQIFQAIDKDSAGAGPHSYVLSLFETEPFQYLNRHQTHPTQKKKVTRQVPMIAKG